MNTKTKTLTLGLSAVLIAGGAGLCTLPQEAHALSKPAIEQKAKTVVFKDKALENYVLQIMKEQKLIPETATEVPLSAAKKLTELRMAATSYKTIGEIKDISDLVNFPNLTDIDISNEQLSDLTPLTKLTKLQNIALFGNNVKDLTPLKSLPELTILNISSNPIGKNIEAILEMKSLKRVGADNINLSNCNFLTKIKDPDYHIRLSHNNISVLPKFTEGTKFKYLNIEYNSILDLSPLKNISGGDIEASYQHAIIDAESSNAFNTTKLPKGTKVFKLALRKFEKIFFDGKKEGVIDGNNLKPVENETSAVFSFSCDDLEKVDIKGCQLLVNYLPKKPATPPVVDDSQSGETYDDGVNAPRTPEPFITAGNLIKEIRQTIEQNKAKYTNEQLAALNTKLADYEKQLKAITDSTENMATRVTKARKLVTELQEMRANPLSAIKGKVEAQKTDNKAKDEKTEKSDKKPIEKIEKTDNLHDKRVFDKDKDKGEKQKGKLPKTSDTAPLGVVGMLAGVLGILAVKPKREKL